MNKLIDRGMYVEVVYLPKEPVVGYRKELGGNLSFCADTCQGCHL